MLFIRALAAFEKPLVAAVEGPAVGVGTTLCFHCDLVYAAPDARFQMPFVNLGLVPEAGASLLAPQRFGYAKAAEFILLAESFDASVARDLGLVNAIVEPGELYAHALAKAQALAAKPRDALLATRRLLRGDPAVLKARMDEELRLFGEAVRSPQARAAFTAFMQKAKA
jgi:enoyl-CoA hydratase/carnithine racemase